ncbi:zinc finger matrin-type protein 3-like [Condylostylus longicornis]|uniref:zinc finger matrin-type protein 3-like n=1 Tax=Condylostylus longicornis TaxID=2530218 RepID=UPI00244DEBFB|nr:zinc finger matrin-type protein 3-like [Condylostylus longicornis]
MDAGRIEDTNRTKINFKIPMKSSKNSENVGHLQSMENFSSPLISDSQQEKVVENIDVNEIRKNTTLTESISNEKPLKRKLNSEMALYAGRNTLYPEELNNLILPLFCKLCNAALNSAKSAHFHYLSKSHDKKINNWLSDWSKRTGEPAPKIEKDNNIIPKDSEIFFCQYCNVKLTSLQDAKQHYSGKKHASKINSGIKPLNKNNVPKNVNICAVDQRFGIGESFKVDLTTVETQNKNVENDLIGPKKVSEIEANSINLNVSQINSKPNTYCEICNIYTTSEQQLTIHMQGTKHFKKFKEVCPEKAFAERDSHLSRFILNCRTPSGVFYCKTCDITVADDKSFSQHFISKRHTRNLKKRKGQPEQNAIINNLKE